MKHQDIIAKLSLEQKCALLSGGTVFTTRALPGKGIPAITLSDGPNGVRKQAGAADHLGLNPSVPATCFPTAVTVACSRDPALGEEEITALVEKFKGVVEANGTVSEIDQWGKRRLAYPINDEEEGVYPVINFTSEPSFPAELDRVYKITEGVVRSLIVAHEE